MTTNKKGTTLQSTITTTNSYNWRDGPLQASINIFTDNVSGSDTNYTTTLSYTGAGQLTSSYIADGRARSVTFITDMAGEILRRDEADANQSGGDPHEIWYRYGGKQLGYTGNNGTLETDYLTSIDNRTHTPPSNPAAFMFGSSAPVAYADFAQAQTPITSYSQGSDAGSYTVRAGDTLQSIAANLWGDSSLWYQLASANGLSGPGSPGAGRSLAIPANVMANAHNASTFKPYDAAKAIGDLSPTNPKPSKKAGGCGMLGQIIMMVVAVAVTAWIAPWATGLIAANIAGIGAVGAAVVGGAIAGAVGSIASQAVGIGIGAQSGFNWKGVGLAAIAGGISGGLAKFGSLAQAGKVGASVTKVAGSVTKSMSTLGKIGSFLGGSGFVSGAARGLLSSALGQGIGVATGLQDKFSWSGVAGAALGGGIGGAIGDRFSALGSFGGNLASNAVGGLANAAARTLIDGSDFGDNLLAALPDIIGSTIGNMLGEAVRIGESQLEPDQAFLAGQDETTPTLAGLTHLYGAKKAGDMMAIFNDATATQLDSHGRLILTPALEAYLAAHAPTQAALAAERARLLDLAGTGGLKAYYDFGYSNNDAIHRFDRSMVSIGDERRAAMLTLQHQGLQPSEHDIDLLVDRVFGGDDHGGNDHVVFPSQQAGKFNSAAGDLRTFVRHRNQFLDALAQSSLAIGVLSGYPGQSAAFGQAIGDMRAGIDHGYFTLRPHTSISNANMTAPMQQYNAAGQSEVIVYREGFSLGSRLFARGIFHELMHAQRMQDTLFSMENPNGHMAGTNYNPDPKTYYDWANQHLYPGIPVGGNSSHPQGAGGHSSHVPDILPNYETGHLYEGNVNNWYASKILNALFH